GSPFRPARPCEAEGAAGPPPPPKALPPPRRPFSLSYAVTGPTTCPARSAVPSPRVAGRGCRAAKAARRVRGNKRHHLQAELRFTRVLPLTRPSLRSGHPLPPSRGEGFALRFARGPRPKSSRRERAPSARRRSPLPRAPVPPPTCRRTAAPRAHSGPHEAFDFGFRPGEGLFERLALHEAHHHLGMDRLGINLHRDLRRCGLRRDR